MTAARMLRTSAWMLLSMIACTDDGQGSDDGVPTKDAGGDSGKPAADGGPQGGEGIGCPSGADFETILEACPTPSSASTCGDGESAPGEVCFESRALAPLVASDLEPAKGDGLNGRWIAAGDLDADGSLDLVVVFSGLDRDDGFPAYTLVVYWGEDGRFGAPEPLASWHQNASHPVLADLDDDGRLDISLRGTMTRVDDFALRTFYGEPERRFESTMVPFVGGYDTTLVGDFDGDGHEDVLFDGGHVVRGLGGRKQALGDELRPEQMQIGFVSAIDDLDGDGARDLVTQLTPPGERTAKLYVVPGAGDGLTSPIGELQDAAKYWTFVLDADGDETLDVAGLRQFPGDDGGSRQEVLVWSGASDYHDTYPVVPLTPLRRAPFGSTSWAASDLDRDGHNDLLFVATPETRVDAPLCELPDALRTVHIAFGDGKGGFTEPPCHPAFTGDPVDIAVADLNGDGAPDIAAATLQGVELLLSNP